MKLFKKNMFYLLLLFLGISFQAKAQNEIKFRSLDEVWNYAEKNSAVIRSGNEQTRLADLAKLSAIANVINFKNQVNFTLTDNTKLPVNFIPSELLGGAPGSFKEVTFGQQFVSNFNFSPQVDLINPGAWANIKVASVNQELTAANNLLNRKSLQESIAACYFNILSINEQIEIVSQNVAVADTLLNILKNKFDEGLTRKQDVNDAEINKLTLQDKLNQMRVSLRQQYNDLKTLCDAPDSANIVINSKLEYGQNFDSDVEANSQLLYRASLLQSDLAKAELGYNFWSQMPTISLVYSNSYSQNSNSAFFDSGNNSGWLNSVYLGLKFTFNLPDVNKVFTTYNADANYEISLINLQHSKLQNEAENKKLKIDYEKSYSQYSTSGKIYELKTDNYNHALNQYKESILPSDKLLTAFTDMFNSRLNYSVALANLLFAQTKIEINNRIK